MPKMFYYVITDVAKLYLANFLGMNHGERSTENCEILAENVRGAAVDEAVAGDHGIAWKLFL